MAVVSTLSNHYKYQVVNANIDFGSNVYKMILLNTTFAFDKDAHATYADVSADELSTEYGYTAGGKTLVNVLINEDDVNDRVQITWDNLQWDAGGGSIGPTGAAILYDDTVGDKTVIGCIDFGQDYTVTDGSSLQLQDIVINGS